MEKAVERLQQFHQIGCDSLKRRIGQGAYGQRQVEAEVAKRKIDPGVFRKPGGLPTRPQATVRPS